MGKNNNNNEIRIAETDNFALCKTVGKKNLRGCEIMTCVIKFNAVFAIIAATKWPFAAYVVFPISTVEKQNQIKFKKIHILYYFVLDIKILKTPFEETLLHTFAHDTWPSCVIILYTE